MARKTELTYFAARRCWKKKHNGKVHYVGPRGVGKSDRDAYALALREWREIEADLAGQVDEEQRAMIRQQHPELHAKTVAARRAVADQTPDAAGDAFEAGVLVTQAGLYENPDFAIDLPGSARAGTIKHHVDGMLNLYRTLAKSGSRSVSRADALRWYLGVFMNWRETDETPSTGQRPVQDITAPLVRAYFTHLLDRVASGEMAPDTARGTFAAFKQLVRHLWQEEIIHLPRNLDDAKFKFDVPAQDIKTYSREQVQLLLNNATGRTKLYLLLALNCGMTAVDISDLQPNEVNWTKGTITRPRSKTRKHSNGSGKVPVVTYPLWPATLKLLRQHKSGSPDHVLLNANGAPLVTKALKDDGKMKRIDNIRLALRRLTTKLDKQLASEAKANGTQAPAAIPQEFRRLRRTGATMIENEYDEALADLWMGHSPRGMAQRHYVAPSQDRLDNALTWLGTQLGITTTAKTK